MAERFVSRGFVGTRRQAATSNRVPPGQHIVTDFPVLSAGPTPRTPLDRWTFTIDGLVSEPVTCRSSRTPFAPGIWKTTRKSVIAGAVWPGFGVRKPLPLMISSGKALAGSSWLIDTCACVITGALAPAVEGGGTMVVVK